MKDDTYNVENFLIESLRTPPPPKDSIFKTRSGLTPEKLIQIYRSMIRARALDEKCVTLYKQSKAFFHVGCTGHEGIQAVAGTIFRGGHDWFYPYYRGLALVSTLGMPNRDLILSFLNKRDDPNTGGRQMPMHYGSPKLRIVNQSSPTGSQYPQAVGCALGASLESEDEVVLVTSGDGACAQGDFHEALNWASRDKLPVVFLVENNGYAISVPFSKQIAAKSIADLTKGYENLTRYKVDGTDIPSSYSILKVAHTHARNRLGPVLVEASVPRICSHSISDNQLLYRSKEELEDAKLMCPIARLRKEILGNGIATVEELDNIVAKVKADIEEAATWALVQSDPKPEDYSTHVYKENNKTRSSELEIEPEVLTGEGSLYMVDAINSALKKELRENPKIMMFGEDIGGGKGGVFSVTKGLTTEFGEARVFSSQLSESAIVGVGMGLATRGFKPVVEIQFGDYVWTAMMQIRNELAMFHYRSNGAFSAPMVIRIPVGGYIHGSAYHSQSIEATFAHFPGLRVVYPSNSVDAQGLLRTAIRCDDPVLFLEHKGLYRQPYAKGQETPYNFEVPFGKAKVVREGSDLTIVSWGMLLHKSLMAAKELEKKGIFAEVIDIRSVLPLDTETIFNSVRKTNKALIAHEDNVFMGFGAEIAAKIAEECFFDLDSPVKRLGMKEVSHVPHSPILEKEVLVQVEDIISKSLEIFES